MISRDSNSASVEREHFLLFKDLRNVLGFLMLSLWLELEELYTTEFNDGLQKACGDYFLPLGAPTGQVSEEHNFCCVSGNRWNQVR